MCFDPCRLVSLGTADKANVWRYLSRDTFAEMSEPDYFPQFPLGDWVLGSTPRGRLFQGHVIRREGHTYFSAGVQ